MFRIIVPLLLALLAACGKPQVANLRVDTSMVPPDTTSLIGVRVDAVRKSPLYAKYLASQSVPGLDNFVAEFGFDPRSDVNEILVASNGKDFLVIARGNFKSAQSKEISGNQFQVIDSGLAVAGPAPLVRTAVERRGKSQKLPDRLQSLIEFIPADAELWSVSGGGWKANFPAKSNLANLDNIIGALDSFSIWGNLAKGLRLGIDGHCTDEQGAKRLLTQVKGLIGLGRLNTPNDKPDLLKLFDAIGVKQEGRSLHLSADVTMELIDLLMKQFEPFSKQRG